MDFQILGPLEVRAGEKAIALGGEKRRALFALLLLHANEPVSAERVAVALWGEEAAADAIKTVRVHVSRIRAALGDPDVLVTTPAGYRLHVAAGELDADRFADLLEQGRRALADGAPAEAAELLSSALALWGGDVLADLRYAAFAQAAIAHLEELRWDAIEARNDAELELGHAEAVLALSDEAPLRERLIEQRMRALYTAGRHVEALSVYREACHRLDAELGLQPGPELRELEREILGHDPSLRPPAAHGPPAPPTPTVGRGADLKVVARMIADRRLVTLTGPGGVGKTRVAIEAARALAPSFPGGVHVAYLAGTDDVPAALVRAAKVTTQLGERDEDALVRRLGGEETLLVADNFEHVLDAAPLLAELVAACPGLHVLATSREPLRLRGEQCLPIAPLAESDAIALFVDRARERRPDFGLTDANAPLVAELCRRLDGLPLAVELAAGRIALLEPEQLVARLANVLPLLEDGPRDAPARQRTIRATLEWSYALLDPAEQQAFRGLAVFVDGADLEAAEAIIEAPVAVLDALVAKSLAQVRHGRVRQLEVLRQFAAGELARAPDAGAVRRRHAEYYLALAERVAPQLRVSGRGRDLDNLQCELANLRAAFDHWIADSDGERSLRLAAALESYWTATSRQRDGMEMIEAALAHASGTSDRARGRARVARSNLLRPIDLEQSARDADAALELCSAAGDLEGRCMALDMVAAHAAYFGDGDRARAAAAEERALAERIGDPYHLAMAAMRQGWSAIEPRAAQAFADEAIPRLRDCGNLRGIIELSAGMLGWALNEGDYEAASVLAEEGLSAAKELGEPMALSLAVGNAGLAALFVERTDVAGQRLREHVEVQVREGLDWWSAEPVICLACVAAADGDAERAATLIGFGEAMPEAPVAAGDQLVRAALVDRFITPARAALGERRWKRAAAAGAAMTADDVIERVLERPVAIARTSD